MKYSRSLEKNKKEDKRIFDPTAPQIIMRCLVKLLFHLCRYVLYTPSHSEL